MGSPFPEEGKRSPGKGRKKVPGAEDGGLEIEKRWLQLVKVDPEQFSFFFNKYHDRIFKFIYWNIGDHDLAGELTGEVFSLAWKKLDRFTWQGYFFGAWLFQIARRCLSHEVRRRRARRETPFDPQIHGGVEDRTAEDEFREERDKALIRMCLDKLPAEPHEVFVLHYWVGLTVDEVALVIKRPRGTICSHLSRGRRTMLKCLEECGLEYGLSRKAQMAVQDQLREDSDLRLVEGNPDPRQEGRVR